MESKPADISIVIPALNEQTNLELLLPAIGEVIGKLGLVAEVIVVDGGSVDESRSVAERLGARVVTQQERGYGSALLAGFAAARAPYVVTMDADLSHQPAFLEDLWPRRADAELVVASRYIKGSSVEMRVMRRALSRLLNWVYRHVLTLPLSDVSSGFRLYQRQVLTNLDLRARDFDALEEILVKLFVRGVRIGEVPFHYRARSSGKSHAQLLKFGWAFSRTLSRMWRLRNSLQKPDHQRGDHKVKVE